MAELFDTEAFLTQTVDAVGDTHVKPIAEGEYTGVVGKVAPRSGVSEKGSWAMLDVHWDIDDPSQAEALGRPNPIRVRQSIFLDVNEAGQLDMSTGKNLALNRLREAVGQNRPGNWSPNMLVGQAATVMTKQELYEGEFQDKVVKAASLN